MSFKRYCLVLLTLAYFLFTPVQAAKIERVVVFGDSLSDNGNLFAMSLHFFPPANGYYKGHFSNGIVWSEYVAQALNLDIDKRSKFINYAYGGAWAEPSQFYKIWTPIPDLTTQVQAFLHIERLFKDISHYLFIIWMGANDYLGVGEAPSVGRSDPEFATTNTVKYIESQTMALIESGAKNVLLMNMPDLSQTPHASTKPQAYSDNQVLLARLHNEKLAAMVNKLRGQYPGVNIILFDVSYYLNDIVSHPDKYGISNVKEACFSGRSLGDEMPNKELVGLLGARKDISPAFQDAVNAINGHQTTCANPDEYLYWDSVHPTTQVNKLLSQFVVDELKKNSVG